MTLAPQKGLRSVYTWAEVGALLGMTRRQVRNQVESGRLAKKYSGAYPFDQKDVNEFLSRLNTGRIK